MHGEQNRCIEVTSDDNMTMYEICCKLDITAEVVRKVHWTYICMEGKASV